jgi:hypothetical protein
MTEDAAIVRACAKVNLLLRVGPRREDGYHELVTLIARISLADVLLISDAAETTVDCPGLPGGDTLVTRALRLLCETAGHDAGFHIHIDKRIPHGDGLGGVSADAGQGGRVIFDDWGRKIDVFSLEGTELMSPPPEIVATGAESIVDYLATLHASRFTHTLHLSNYEVRQVDPAIGDIQTGNDADANAHPP